MEYASASLVDVRVVRFLQHRNVRVLVWSMCEWSGFHNTEMFDRVKVWSMCEWSDIYNTGMCEWLDFYNIETCEC